MSNQRVSDGMPASALTGIFGTEFLGKYTIVRRVGTGGMADVYLARLRGIGGFDKQVVIKRIRADVRENREFVEMFLDEARLAARLNHSNIVQIFEADEADGVPYIAMEYVHGPTFTRVISALGGAQATDYAHLAYLMAQVAAGLHHAHNARDPEGQPLHLVHRDVSPHNIIIGLDGTAKLFDFGVAKARGSMTTTQTGVIKGKVGYMAPEQLRSENIDYRADIYAVGVTLYEATVGRRPFQGKTEAELFAARFDGRFPAPSELVPDFPPELERIILAAMAPDPDDRPTGWDLSHALSSFAASDQHGSSATAVADWLHALVGANEVDFAGQAYSSNPGTAAFTGGVGSGSLRSSNGTRSSQVRRPQPAQQIGGHTSAYGQVAVAPTSRRNAVVLLGSLLVIAAVLGVLVLNRDSGATAPPVAGVEASSRSISTYLDEAERLVASDDLDAAEEILGRVRELQTDDPELNIRSAKLAARIKDRERLRAEAEVATATATAPSHGTAAVAAAAVAVPAAPTASPPRQAPGRQAPRVVRGRLTLSTEDDADVFVDGDLIGDGSFSERLLPVGTHVVMVEKEGYASARSRVEIRAGRESKLKLPLAKLQPKAKPQAEPEAAVPDCSPPYYYDGVKKIFKPACL